VIPLSEQIPVGGVFVAIFNGLIVGLITFGGLFLLFIALVNFAGSREKPKLERQLPDTLTLMSTSLRAGYSLLRRLPKQ
jgi:Flp pilus assembly protein TadB